jgi:hypothetical protein
VLGEKCKGEEEKGIRNWDEGRGMVIWNLKAEGFGTKM